MIILGVALPIGLALVGTGVAYGIRNNARMGLKAMLIGAFVGATVGIVTAAYIIHKKD